MIVLDENMHAGRRRQLHAWHIPARQIGYDVGRAGMDDDEIITLLPHLPRPTFFSLDHDYYTPKWRHARYCLVYIVIEEPQAAYYVRRVLRHPALSTNAKRMGLVIRASPDQITVWRLHSENEEEIAWN
jgi:hypothetical protein